MPAEIEDFLEGFNQPTNQAMRVNGGPGRNLVEPAWVARGRAAAAGSKAVTPLAYGQAETNEETSSQTTPQSPSERSSTAINAAPGQIRPAIPSAERLASRATAVLASTKLTKFRQEMTASRDERRFAVKRSRYDEYGAHVLYLASPRLPLWQPLCDGPHPHNPNAKHRAPLASPN
jgi:hypothetical protein